jgi:E3 ubiquitin-protein ligase RGLG
MCCFRAILRCLGYPEGALSIKQGQSAASKREYRFETIRDKYRSIEEVQQALRDAGLENSNLIIGVDFTHSNTWTGQKSFNRRCLHDTTGPPNPYQQVIGIVGRTLEAFDDDHLIPAFGFGDSFTTDKDCFPFYPDRPCNGLSEVLSRYLSIAPGEPTKPTNHHDSDDPVIL